MDTPRGPMPRHHEVFYKFRPQHVEATQGFRVNFLGVKTREAFFTQWGDRRRSTADYPDFDEEYFEWIDLLESVTQAESHFTMLELGAGFGYWLSNAAAALKQCAPLPYTLIGVEAEPTHFRWMKEHLQENGVDLSRCRLIQAAVADRDGTIGFHVGETPQGGPADWYGQSIGGPEQVRAVSLSALLEPLHKVDLIDLDVEGAELQILEVGASQLNAKVKRVHIETHSHEIESGLRSLFARLGWQNLCDYPCHGEVETEWGRIVFQGGVQSWINPRFFTPHALADMRTRRIPTALGFDLLLDAQDYMSYLLLKDGVFEGPETDLVIRLLRPGDTCLDAGCHVGYYTSLMARLVDPKGRVYAFDANPWCCQRTKRNLAWNNLTGVEIIQAALGDRRGATSFYISTDDQTGLSSLGSIEPHKEVISVPWLRLDDFFRKRGLRKVRLLKIDVEGAEELVLKGLERYLSAHAIDFILVECFDERLRVLNTSAERVAAILQSAGYTAWEYGTEIPAGWSRTTRVRSRGDCNYLFASPSAVELPLSLSLAGAWSWLRDRRDRLRQERDQLQQRLEALQNHTEQLQAHIQQLQAERDHLLQAKAAVEQECEKAQDKIGWLLTNLTAQVEEARRLRQEKQQLENLWRAVEGSAGWGLLNAWRRLRNRLAPEGSLRRQMYDAILDRFRSRI